MDAKTIAELKDVKALGAFEDVDKRLDSLLGALKTIHGTRKVSCAFANRTTKDLTLKKVMVIHGKLWEVNPPGTIKAGTIATWHAIKGDMTMYGTHLIVIYSDGTNDYVMSGENPLTGQMGISSLVTSSNKYISESEGWWDNATNGKYPKQRSNSYHTQGNLKGWILDSSAGVLCKWDLA